MENADIFWVGVIEYIELLKIPDNKNSLYPLYSFFYDFLIFFSHFQLGMSAFQCMDSDETCGSGTDKSANNGITLCALLWQMGLCY